MYNKFPYCRNNYCNSVTTIISTGQSARCPVLIGGMEYIFFKKLQMNLINFISPQPPAQPPVGRRPQKALQTRMVLQIFADPDRQSQPQG